MNIPRLFHTVRHLRLQQLTGRIAHRLHRLRPDLVFAPENVEALLDGLRRFRDDARFYRACRDRALAGARNYDRAELAARMLKILEGTVARSGALCGPAL